MTANTARAAPVPHHPTMRRALSPRNAPGADASSHPPRCAAPAAPATGRSLLASASAAFSAFVRALGARSRLRSSGGVGGGGSGALSATLQARTLVAALGVALGIALCVAVARPGAVVSGPLSLSFGGGGAGDHAAAAAVAADAAAAASDAAASDAAAASGRVAPNAEPAGGGAAEQKAPPDGAVTVWAARAARRCRGRFAAAPAPDSPSKFPYAVLRDAVVDNRFASREEFRARNKDIKVFERIVLYVTAHLSVELVKPVPRAKNASASDSSGTNTVSADLIVIDNNESTSPSTTASMTSGDLIVVSDVAVAVDYVLHVNPFVVHPSYKPGTTTFYGQEVSEWQVVLSLSPSNPQLYVREELFAERLRALVDHGASVNLSLPLERYDGKTVMFRPSFALACVIGWENTPRLAADMTDKRRDSCRGKPKGAVAFAGSALHGKTRADPRKVLGIAHFAARALTGSMRFDLVVIPAIVNNSLSEAIAECKREPKCLRKHHTQNENFLDIVKGLVEQELHVLGVPSRLFRRVVILPMCRLGSHARGSERGSPCSQSFWSGQYIATYFGYTLISSYFKWASILDIDEFVSVNKGVAGAKLDEEPAADRFDEVNTNGKNAILFSWLNFLVKNSTRSLTRSVMDHRTPVLKDRTHKSVDCYKWPPKDTNGKAALRCDRGLGFTIHRAVQLPRNAALDAWSRETYVLSPALRAWHPRLQSSMGKCEHVLDER